MMQGMELIRHRRSVRTFDGRALKAEDAQRILERAAAMENPWGIPVEWKLLSAKAQGLSSPVIVGADSWIAGKLRRVPHAEEAFGYAFERLVLYAESLGIGTTLIAGTMDRPAFERAMALGPDEVMPCVSPLGYPAERMSLRETMMRKGVRADSRLDFSALFYDGSFTAPLTPARAGALQDALEMLRWAPSAVNKQPWRIVVKDGYAHFYEKKDKGYTSKDNWDIQKIDMGIAMCHFALGLEEAGKAVDFEISDPGIETTDKIRYIASIRY